MSLLGHLSIFGQTWRYPIRFGLNMEHLPPDSAQIWVPSSFTIIYHSVMISEQSPKAKYDLHLQLNGRITATFYQGSPHYYNNFLN